jgi:predicted acetyltransferase
MTRQIDLRSCTAEDWPAFIDAFTAAFSSDMPAEVRESFERLLHPSRLLVATEGEAVVGTAGVLAFEMGVPGGEIPVAGITLVGVRPTHRRRGILRQMMRRMLDDAHERGEPVAILWASEPAIYQRFGFGMGTVRMRIDAERGGAAMVRAFEPVGTTRMVSEEEALALLPEVYERASANIPGSLRRSLDWWMLRVVNDPTSVRHGGSRMFRVALEIDGGPEAYALYRVHSGWTTEGLRTTWLDVLEAIGTTPVATREIWRYLFSVDLVVQVRTHRICRDHPLLLWLADPRQLRPGLLDGIWARVVDVSAALSARRYGAPGSLTFELVDPFCAWNEGVWRLTVDGERGTIERSTASPELRLTAAELSAMYLGGVTCTSLLQAGRLDELAPGAADRADLMFRSAVPPWCLEEF